MLLFKALESGAARNPDFFLFTVCSVWILFFKSRNPDWNLFVLKAPLWPFLDLFVHLIVHANSSILFIYLFLALAQSLHQVYVFLLGPKIGEIFTIDSTICSKCQFDDEDFAIFCGLLRKHELYLSFTFANHFGFGTILLLT